jgi:uncharacterized protein YndB with AHSA1/START domain
MTDTPLGTRARELTITRVFDAPRELVFQAWTDPAHLAGWYGPSGFSTPRSKIDMDVRAGGAWSACMVRDDDGFECLSSGVYREVSAPERLVFTWAIEPEPGVAGDESVVTVVFADLGGKTRMTFTQSGFVTDGERTNVEGGWTEALAKLAERMEK